jgi:hypothetical protein
MDDAAACARLYADLLHLALHLVLHLLGLFHHLVEIKIAWEFHPHYLLLLINRA